MAGRDRPVSTMRRPRHATRRPGRRWKAILGWGLTGVVLAVYLANEFSVDVPAVHYGMYVVMLAGASLGFSAL